MCTRCADEPKPHSKCRLAPLRAAPASLHLAPFSLRRHERAAARRSREASGPTARPARPRPPRHPGSAAAGTAAPRRLSGAASSPARPAQPQPRRPPHLSLRAAAEGPGDGTGSQSRRSAGCGRRQPRRTRPQPPPRYLSCRSYLCSLRLARPACAIAPRSPAAAAQARAGACAGPLDGAAGRRSGSRPGGGAVGGAGLWAGRGGATREGRTRLLLPGGTRPGLPAGDTGGAAVLWREAGEFVLTRRFEQIRSGSGGDAVIVQ